MSFITLPAVLLPFAAAMGQLSPVIAKQGQGPA
jgi:hypothetical protein